MRFVSGSENISTIFKQTRNLAPKEAIILALEYVFGLPKAAIDFYEADDSGTAFNAHPQSKVEPQNRIFYIQHKTMLMHLSGSALNDLTRRFLDNLRYRISESRIGSEWVEMPDLYSFLQVELFHASVEAMCGPIIFRLNPNFSEDFWAFDKCVPNLFKRLPRWMVPGSYRSLEKALKTVKQWHAAAHEQYDPSQIAQNDEDWDQYFGSKLIKERIAYSKKMGPIDEDALASEDLGLLWATNSNSIPAACWFLLELVRDSSLLSRVRNEVESAFIPSSDPRELQFDITKLCSGPLLQSIYAETLRLRVALIVTRTPERSDYKLGNWIFPRNELIAISSRDAGLNEEIWNTGTAEDPHPLDEFWADRFLIYPDDPNSGPLKKPGSAQNEKSLNTPASSTGRIPQETPTFSLEGLSGAWIPYGGGQRMCPGRHFAKQEMIASFALLCTAYDIELLTEKDFKPEVDMTYFLSGGLPPKGKIPFRIRRKVV